MPPKKKPKPKIYSESYTTEGQKISRDGATIIMQNGRAFRRTVLPAGSGLSIYKQDEIAEDLTSDDYDPDKII